MTPRCSYIPCGREARPGEAPALCDRHADLVICPTCEYWPWSKLRLCQTCHGRWYVTEAGARRAVDGYARVEEWERRNVPLEARDSRWLACRLFGVYSGRSEPPGPDTWSGAEAPWCGAEEVPS